MKRVVIASVMAMIAVPAWASLAVASPPSGPVPPDGGAPAAPVPGSYSWPVVGQVIRGFEPPQGPYGAGHRGIDIAVPFGTRIRAPSDGVVSFAGWVGGALYLSIDHPDGVRTTYSWLSSVAVKRGDAVRRGDVVGATGHGHPEVPTPHLHFGARIGTTYIDPMILLEGADVTDLIHLAPLGSGP